MAEKRETKETALSILKHLENQGVQDNLIREIRGFRKEHEIQREERMVSPTFFYEGAEIWNRAIAALLEGQHLLLCGPKATGKNVLAENLAAAFGRPLWTVSFHVHTDSASLMGTDTFVNNQVMLRPGSVYEAAVYGGFGIFDEINMAKNDAVSVLHSALDYRRIMDVPGYEQIRLHPATRFIGTMNYGYAGTRELNEALVSRFMVIHMPPMKKERLEKIMYSRYPNLRKEAAQQFAGLFMDLQLKAQQGEISTKAVDVRGLLAAIGAMRQGLTSQEALDMGVGGKIFDAYEKEIVEDVIQLRMGKGLTKKEVFVYEG